MPHLAAVGEGLGLPELDSPLPPASPLSPAQQAIAERFRATQQMWQTVQDGFVVQKQDAVVSGAPSRRATPRSPTDEAVWEAQLARLAAYKAAHGDCSMPYDWAEDPRLATWIKT